MKIVLGTTSDQKIGYFKEVLLKINIDLEIETVEVSSGISEQPCTSKETKLGSINRAKNALNKSTDADLAIGIEFGYDKNKDGKFIVFCWSTIVDKKGKQISACSHKMILPEFHQQKLKEGVYLSDFVNQYLDETKDEASLYFGQIIKDRKPFIQVSIESALLNYFVK